MTRAAVIGLGKMGLSHLAILRSTPNVEVVGVCDSNPLVTQLYERHANIKGYTNFERLLDAQKPEAVLISTPTRSHAHLIQSAIDRGVHTFCEKPLTLSHAESASLASKMNAANLVGQVGYHYRYLSTFSEARRLVHAGILGRVHHVRIEAYGPVMLKKQGLTWRSSKSDGGGCLYDYASHAIDLLNYIFKPPTSVTGTVMRSVFSNTTEDEVYSTLTYNCGATGQLAVNWSDETHRKMSVKVIIWGESGKIDVDRQEISVYLKRCPESEAHTYSEGWTVRNTTSITPPVDYYLRGEEYSAQIADFVDCIRNGREKPRSTFDTAAETDRVIDMLAANDDANAHARSTPRHRSKRFPFNLLNSARVTN